MRIRQHQAAIFSIMEAEDDPEDSLLVALTMRDLAVVSYGLAHVWDLCYEARDAARNTGRKLEELTKAQGFLDWGPE